MLYIFGYIWHDHPTKNGINYSIPPKKVGRFGIHIQRKAGPSQGRPFPG